MKQLLIIITFCLCSFGIFAQTFRQSEISDALRKSVEKELFGETGRSIWETPSFYQHLSDNNLNDFVQIMLIVNPAIDSIVVDIPAITIFGNYQERFALEGGVGMIYEQFHDIYSSLFSFDEIDIISVFDCWYDCRNITFLPITAPDYIVSVENAIFKRIWYIPNIDYLDIIGIDILENDDFFNEVWEFSAKKLDYLIRRYKEQNPKNYIMQLCGSGAANSYAQVTYESIKRCEVKSFLRTHLSFVDLNPMWQAEADEINNFIKEILSKDNKEKDVDSLRIRAFQLLYNNTWTIFEDAVDTKRMSIRRAMCFLAIALLSDDHRYGAFINDARISVRSLERNSSREETLISIVEILMTLGDNEMLPREKNARINDFVNSFNEKKTNIDDESFVRDVIKLFSPIGIRN